MKTMQKFAIALATFLVMSNSEAAIVECSSTKMVLDIADQDSIVFFNITDTIYVSYNMCGKAVWRDYLAEKVNEAIENPSDAQNTIIKFKGAIMRAMPKKLVEEVTPLVIAQLQQKQIPVFGFTLKDRSLPWAHNYDEMVRKNIRGLGINFEKTSQYFNVPFNPKHPYLVYGILFAEGKSRTDAIKDFMHTLPKPIKKVILVDDRMINLVSVEKALESEGYEFHGFRYNQSDALEPMDPILGIIEFEQFLADGSVMNDSEALAIKQLYPNKDYDDALKKLITKNKPSSNLK